MSPSASGSSGPPTAGVDGRWWRDTVSGATAGMVSVLALHPLDVIKTRLQVQDGIDRRAATYRGTVHAFRTVVRSEGALGLYAGLSPAVIGSTLSWAAYFGCYNNAKQRYAAMFEVEHLPSHLHLLSAAEAGLVVSLATNPIWVAKTRLQLQRREPSRAPEGGGARTAGGGAAAAPYRGFVDCITRIARAEGVPGLYRGIAPSLFLVSHGALQFAAYEKLKRWWTAAAAAGGDDAHRAAVAEEALVKAREALKATLTRVGAGEEPRSDGRDGDDEDDGSRADSRDSDSDDSDALVAAGAGASVSEFGVTWMMLDGWVTRATFAYVSADDVDAESDSEPSALPPRLGYAKQMSDAAASELRRALPSVRAALGIRASALQLERSLGELLRTFFFDAAIPGLRPERWALLVAAMLERGVAARAAAAARKRSAANANEKIASGTKQDAAVVPPIAEDVAAARRDGGPLWALVAAAGATKEEYDAYGDLIAGECAKSW